MPSGIGLLQMYGNAFALIELLGVDGQILNGHLPCDIFRKSYSIVKRIGFLCENVYLSLWI